MFPLDPELLLIVKFFIFLTCLFFWIKLAYDSMLKSTRLRHRHDHERQD